MASFKEDLNKFEEFDAEIYHLDKIGILLEWDQRTLMKSFNMQNRSLQQSLIAGIIHKKIVSDDFKELVRNLAKEDIYATLDFSCKRKVDKYVKKIKRLENIPLSHVKEYSELVSVAGSVWEKAKKNNDFELFKPYLKKIVDMKLLEARYIDSSENPYNVLLDAFEEGMTIDKLNIFFDKLKKGLLEILNKVKSSDVYKKNKDDLKLSLDLESKKFLSFDISSRILGKDCFVLAESVHPFSVNLGIKDVRFTTNFDNDFHFFYSCVHEAGHSLYERNMGDDLGHSIIRDSSSYGLHESQSRLWENHVGKNKVFLDFYFKTLKEQGLDVSFDDFYFHINKVKSCSIRTKSDELSYCLHIIIRFEIERALLEKTLSVDDVRVAWNKKYEDYLGVLPVNDSEGVLQDVHWSSGAIGYFPSYALGSVYAAMLTRALSEELDFLGDLKNGFFDNIKVWLANSIQVHGSLFLTSELMKKITGKDLDVNDYLDYLREKYYSLYNIKD